MQIAIFIYDHMTALDAVGPYEVLSRLPGAETVFVGANRGEVRCDTGVLALVADASIHEVQAPDVLVVGGWSGAPQTELLGPGPVQDWLRSVDRHTTWTTSTCTGSLALAAAGLLTGRRATTHWLALDDLAALGAVPSRERVVVTASTSPPPASPQGSTWPSTLAAAIADDRTAQAIQLGIEYDPQPPFSAGTPDTAPREIVTPMRALKDFILYGAA